MGSLQESIRPSEQSFDGQNVNGQKAMDTKIQMPWWEQILRGEKDGLLAGSIRQIARLGSLGYGVGIRGREMAYKRGWLSVKRLPQPTICVGNITVGGTGKTPLVIRLAGDLMARGLKPAVLLRGYKRKNLTRTPILVRDARRIVGSLHDSGDEAMELAVRLPGACVGVGADRYAVGRFVSQNHPVDCFILDDGFQHHRLERDINIVTMDVSDPWGGGALLPAGLLREPPEALRRADAVVLTRAGSAGPDRLRVLRAQVSMFMRPSSGLMESRHEPRELISLRNQQAFPLAKLKGQRVLAISGIGNPQSFEQMLIQSGADIVDRLRLSDHEGTPEQVCSWIQNRRQDNELIVMTEKDAMRWNTGFEAYDALRSACALRMDLVLSSGQEHWKNLIDLIERLIHAQS